MQRPAPERTIQVLWLCGRGVQCNNEQQPGTHTEYDDCAVCVGVHIEAPVIHPDPVLIVGTHLPVIVGAA